MFYLRFHFPRQDLFNFTTLMNAPCRTIPRCGRLMVALFAVLAIFLLTVPVHAQARKPNILVIWGDDIGTWNISFNSRGMMGYKTPNIDRIAKEGVSFTDYYGQQS